mmetsp:Transcript_81569/g.253288  ORF Transcript_81569/g.253288 Transcript_81569/m.253288 type:complete len:96 (+) Transcript_81569:232-519(+)
MSLRDRAQTRTGGTLSRSMSLPAGSSAPPGASWRTLAKRYEADRPAADEHRSLNYTGARGDGTVGRFKYVPPADCVEIMQNWSTARAASGIEFPR